MLRLAEPIGEGDPGVLARAAGAQLESEHAQMVGQVGVAAMQLVGDAVDRRVEREAGLHRGDQEGEQVGEAHAVFELAAGAPALNELVGAHDRHERQDRGDADRAHAALVQRPGEDRDHADDRGDHAGGAGAEVNRHGFAAVVAGLHEPRAQG